MCAGAFQPFRQFRKIPIKIRTNDEQKAARGIKIKITCPEKLGNITRKNGSCC